MTEDQLMAAVIGELDRRGLLWHHDPDSRRSQGSKGFPDLVIASRHAVLFREVKGEDGETSADQDEWGWTLREPGLVDYEPFGLERWAVWSPREWRSGLIKMELKAIG